MTLDDFIAVCKGFKGVEITYPFGPQALWMKVGGKAFAWTFVAPFMMDKEERAPFTFINMKCAPEQAIEWREQYEAVHPGWHQNKKYWNSVFMDGIIPNNIHQMLEHAYQEVFNSLPKKTQQKILANE